VLTGLPSYKGSTALLSNTDHVIARVG
jgi:hypothetical protein